MDIHAEVNEIVDLSQRPNPCERRPLVVWKSGGAVADELRLLNVNPKFRARSIS